MLEPRGVHLEVKARNFASVESVLIISAYVYRAKRAELSLVTKYAALRYDGKLDSGSSSAV